VFGQSVIVSLPADDNAIRERVFDVLAKDGKPFVCRADEARSLTMEVRLPEESKALDELKAWAHHPAIQTIPAPWDPVDGRTSEQKQQDLELASVCGEIMAAASKVDLEQYQAISKKYAEQIRRGDREAIKQMEQEHEQLRRGVLFGALDELEKKYPAYSGMFAACREEMAKSGSDLVTLKMREFCKPYVRLASTGQVNMYGVKSANCGTYGGRTSITLMPISMQQCGPAVVQYLSARGVTGIHYYLSSAGRFGDELED
jgi:hypothetical protein